MSTAPSAAELIAEANAATTSTELDTIEALAEGRVTVINAVHDRRDQLAAQGAFSPTMTEQPLEQPVVSGVAETPASPDEVLAEKPNTAAEATEGPHPQISSTTYVEMTKPNGDVALVPLSNVPDYEARGLTAGAEVEIEDLVAYWAEKAAS